MLARTATSIAIRVRRDRDLGGSDLAQRQRATRERRRRFVRHDGGPDVERTRCGRGRGLWVAGIFDLVMLALLAALLWSFGLGIVAVTGVAIVAALLAYEHSLVSASDLKKLNAAFFTMNGVISVVFLLFVAGDLLLRR